MPIQSSIDKTNLKIFLYFLILTGLGFTVNSIPIEFGFGIDFILGWLFAFFSIWLLPIKISIIEDGDYKKISNLEDVQNIINIINNTYSKLRKESFNRQQSLSVYEKMMDAWGSVIITSKIITTDKSISLRNFKYLNKIMSEDNIFVKNKDIIEGKIKKIILDDQGKLKGYYCDEIILNNENEEEKNYEIILFLENIIWTEKSKKEIDLICFVRDVAEQKLLTKQLLHDARLKDLGITATALAHELSQPLEVIMLASANLENFVSREDSINQKGKAYIDSKIHRIQDQVLRAKKISDSLRVFGRSDISEAGWFSLKNSIDGVVEIVRPKLQIDNIELDYQMHKKDYELLGSHILFSQVISNIIINAIEQFKNTKDELNSLIRIVVEEERENTLVIKIADNAGGVSDEIIDDIFQPFVTSRGVGDGTGLGLSLAYGIIKDMNGEISVKNVHNGACFLIKLPFIINKQEL